MIELNLHGITITVWDDGEYDDWVVVETETFPDGSPTNELNARELREVADMFTEAATEMED